MRLRVKKSEAMQSNHLTDLQLKFDAAIRNGDSFRDVKRIYTRIKHLKNYIRSINIE